MPVEPSVLVLPNTGKPQWLRSVPQKHTFTHLDHAGRAVYSGVVKLREAAAVAQRAPKQLDVHNAKDDEVEGGQDDDVHQHGQAGNDGAHEVLQKKKRTSTREG